MDLDWGTVPGWIAAVGTSGSLLTAARVYARTLTDRERQQAAQVSATYQDPVSPGGATCTVSVRNSSDLPVQQPVLHAVVPRPSGRVRRPARQFLTLGLGQQLTDSWKVSSLAAHENVATTITLADGDQLPELVSMRVTFRDAAGLEWSRDVATGQLRRLTPRSALDRRLRRAARVLSLVRATPPSRGRGSGPAASREPALDD